MKRTWSLLFLSVFMSIVTTAPVEPQDDKAAIMQTMKDYYALWADLGPGFDLRLILPYYHEPMMVISTATVSHFPMRADIERAFKGFVTGLRQRGVVRGELRQLHIQQLAPGVAVASAEVARRGADGQELERLGYLYVLRKATDGWKIATLVGHDARTVLRLE